MARAASATVVLLAPLRPVVGCLLALRLHSVRTVLGMDRRKWLVAWPGRGPCIQYRILLDARMGLAPVDLIRWIKR